MKNKSSYGINSNKQIIEIIAFFLFTLMATAQVYGQSFNQSLLINKEWINQIPEKTYYTIYFFTAKEKIVKSFVNDGVKTDIGLKEAYYLSNEVVDNFQPDLVGKSKNGKYLVTYSKPKNKEGHIVIYEILELTNTKLKTKNLSNGMILEYYVKE